MSLQGVFELVQQRGLGLGLLQNSTTAMGEELATAVDLALQRVDANPQAVAVAAALVAFICSGVALVLCMCQQIPTSVEVPKTASASFWDEEV